MIKFINPPRDPSPLHAPQWPPVKSSCLPDLVDTKVSIQSIHPSESASEQKSSESAPELKYSKSESASELKSSKSENASELKYSESEGA